MKADGVDADPATLFSLLFFGLLNLAAFYLPQSLV